jgi:hypothetical protein
VRFRVRTDTPEFLDTLRAHLPPGSRASNGDDAPFLYSFRSGGPVDGVRNFRRYFVGYSHGVRFVRTLDEREARDAFETAVRFDVAVTSRRWVFVHAGVVGWRGRAIVVPAASMSGKSRLVEALVRAGATYYSDEFAVLDAEGRVHPFRKPLDIRTDGGPARRIAAADLGAAGRAPGLPIAVVASTRYEAGAVWRPQVSSPAAALLALFANTVRARLAPAPIMKTLARAVERAVLLEGPRGEAAPTAVALLQVCSHGSPSPHEQDTRAPFGAREGLR